MRTGTAKIVAVAPWFDITNSYQRYWISNHRWKNPEYFSEYPSDLFSAPSELDALLSPSCGVQQKFTEDQSIGMQAPVGP